MEQKKKKPQKPAILRRSIILKNLGIQGMNFTLDKEFNFIGRLEKNEVSIPLEGISDRHALIFQKEGIFYCVDLASRLGTRINDREASGTTEIRNGDTIAFDKQVFAVVDPEARGTIISDERRAASQKTAGGSPKPADTTRTMVVDRDEVAGAHLTIEFGPEQGRRIPLSRDRKTSIARKEINENTAVIDHPSISRSGHCVVYYDRDTWRIADSGSTNGVTVNGSPVANAELANGDEIELGQVVLRFNEGTGGAKSGGSWDAKTVVDDTTTKA